MSSKEGQIVARQCYEYLKPGGCLRIAVPDGNFPDSRYILLVDTGMDGHKELYNNELICELFEGAGFIVNILEYFDLIFTPIDALSRWQSTRFMSQR